MTLLQEVAIFSSFVDLGPLCHGTLLEEVPWQIEGTGRHGTLLEGVPCLLLAMGLHGTLLEGVPWPIDSMGHS